MLWKVGYVSVLRLSPFMLFACVLLLLLVFVPHIGQEINGAKRWIGIAGIGLQPSEFVKYLIPIYFIDRITVKRPESFFDFINLLVVFLFPLGLILIQPDSGTTAMILFTLIILFFLTRIPWLYWMMPLLVISIIGCAMAYQMPHVRNRLEIYIHPEKDLRGKGHQPFQARIAAGSGGLWGKGLGESMQKLNYLPEARSDYIAAIYAEEFGFVGICFLIVLYMIIAFSGFSIAIHSKRKEGFYLASIITFMIAFQAFLNLGVVSGLLPSKGITLPFFSQGGSSLINHFLIIAILLSIAKKPQKQISYT
jgi:cell division protein FtsW